MKIYPKILLSVLPIVILTGWGTFLVHSNISRQALTTQANLLLEIQVNQAKHIATEYNDLLMQYGLGNVSASVSQAQFDAASELNQVVIGESGFIMVVNQEGIIILHPDETQLGQHVDQEPWYPALTTSQTDPLIIELQGRRYLMRSSFLAPWGWYMVAVQPEAEIIQPVQQALTLGTLLIFIISMFVLVLFAWFTRIALKPLQLVTEAARKIGSGNYDVQIPVTSGDELGSLAVVFNQTAKKIQQSVAALRENEERYRALFDQAGDGIFISDLDGNYLDVNASGCELLGYSRAEILQMNIRDLVTPELNPKPIQFTELRAGQTVRNERILRHHDGHGVIVDVSGRRVNGDLLQAIVRDAAERKQAEQSMQRAGNFLKSALDALSAHIAILDENGRIINVNSGWQQFGKANGLTMNEAGLGSNYLAICEAATGSTARDAQSVAQSIRQLLAGEIVDAHIEYPCHSPTEHRWFIAHLTAFTEDGKSRVVVAHENITARLEAESKVREHEANLHALVENVNGTIWSVDDQYRLITANQQFQNRLTTARGRSLGNGESVLYDGLPDDFRDLWRERYDRALGGETFIVQDATRFTTDERILENHFSPIRDDAGVVVGVTVFGLDITERVQADRQLRILSSAVEHSPVSIVITDAEWAIEYVNPYFSQVTGYTLHDVIGKNTRIFQSGLTPKEMYTQLSNRIKAGEEWRGEFLNKKKNGELYWEDASISPILNEDGQIIHFVAIKADITERKQSEATLRASEERYRALFEESPISIWEEDYSEARQYLEVLKEQGVTDFRSYFDAHPEEIQTCASRIRIMDVNQTTLHMYGAEDKAVLLKGMDQFLTPEFSVNFVEELICVAEGKTSINWEGVDQTVQGENFEISVHWRAPLAPMNDYSKVIVSIIDVRERKQAEKKLRESEERYRNLFDSAREGIVVTGPAGTFIDANPAGVQMLGFESLEAMLGKSAAGVYAQSERRSEIFAELQQQDYLENVEIELIKQDGSGEHVFVLANGVLQRDEHGQPLRAEVMFIDITDRKQAEQALERSERTFKHFANFAPVPVAMFDRDMHYLAASKRYLADFNLPDQDLVGHSHYEIFPEIPERWKEIHRRCLAGAIEKADDDPFLRADGTLDWVRWEIHPWHEKSGEVGGIIWFSEVITERKKADDELRGFQELLRSILATVPDYILRIERDGRIAFINHTYPGVTIDQVTGTNVLDWIPPEHQPRFQEMVSRAWATGLPAEMETVGSGVNNQPAWYLTRVGPILENDEVTALTMVGQDITERKQAEQKLAESEERYRLLFDNARDGIVITGPKGTYIDANKVAVKMLGFKNLQDMLGKPVLPLYSQPERRAELTAKLMADGYFENVEVELIRQDGSGEHFFILVNSVLRRDEHGQILQIEGVFTDITARKRAELALKRSEAHLDEAQRIAHLGSWEWLAETDTPTWSRELCAILEVDPDQPLPSMAEQDALYTPDSMVRMRTSVEKTMQTGEPYEIELERIRADGSRRWLLARGERWFDESGNLLGLRGTALDITGRKQAEEQLRESELRLKLALEAARTGVWELDLNTYAIITSPNMDDILGFEVSTMDFNAAWEMVHPDDRGWILTNIQDVIEQHSGFASEFRMIKKDGSTVWLNNFGQAYYDEADRPIRMIGIITDITERKQAAEQLQRSETRFRSLVENSSDQVLISDTNGNLLYESPSSNPPLGYATGEFLGKSLMKLVHPDDVEHVQGRLAELIHDPGLHPREQFRLKHQDGHWVWVEAVGSNMLDEPAVGGIVINYHDITGRKEAEEKIVYQAKLLNAVGSSVIATDLAGIVQYWNPAAERIFGWPASETIGRNILEITPGSQSQEQSLEIMQKLQQGEMWSGEITLQRKDGSRFPAFVSDSPLQDSKGNLIGIVGVSDDITKIKQTETALREAQERLVLVIQSGKVGLWDWDLRTNKVIYSPEWKRQLGYQEHEVQNDFSEWESRVHPDDLERAMAIANAYLEKPYPDYQNEFRMRHKDGSYRWILAQASLDFDEHGQPYRMMGSHIDITERKQAEAELRYAQELFQKSFQSSPLVTVLTKLPERTIVDVNGAFEKVTGYKRAETIGKSVMEVDLWVDAAERQRVADELIKNGRVQGQEFLLKTKSGATRIGVFNAQMIEQQADKYVLTMIMDVTERKQAETKLRESEARFSRVFHSSPSGINLFRLSDGRSIDVNHAFTEITGYATEEIIGHTSQELNLFANLNMRADWLQVLREGKAIQNQDVQIRRKSGEMRDCLFSIDLIDIQGEPIGLVTARDVTERKKAERALEAAELKFRNLVVYLPAVVYTSELGMAGKWTYISPQVEALLGFTPEEWMADPGLWYAQIHPDDRERQKTLEAQARERNEPLDDEYRIRTRAGAFIWVRDTAHILPGPEGGVPIAQGTMIDITARKQAEIALRISEDRYRILFEDSPIAIWEEDYSEVKQYLDTLKAQGVTDFEAHFDSHPDDILACASKIRIIDVNQAALRMYGAQSKPELLNGIGQFLTPDLSKNFVRELIGVAEGNTSMDWDGLDRTLQGQAIEVSLQWRVPPAYVDDYSKVIVSIIDITERRQAERSLLAAERDYRTIFENAPVGIFQSSPSGRFLKVNATMANIYGYKSPDEMLKQVNDLATQIHLGQASRQRFQELIEVNGAVIDYENQNLRKDRAVIWTSTNARCVRDTEGQTLYYEGFIRDITSHKLAEANLWEKETQLQRLNDNLPNGYMYQIDFGSDGSLRNFNYIGAGVERLFGISPQQVLADPTLLQDQFLEEDNLHAAQLEAEAFATMTTFRTEVRYKKKNQQIGWMLLTSSPRRLENNHVVWDGVALDITESKQAEESLVQHAERMATLSQASQRVLTTFDLDEIYQDTHAAVQKLMPCETFVIAILDQTKQAIDDVFLWDAGQRWQSEHHSVGSGLTDYIIASGKTLRVNEWDEDQIRMTNSQLFGNVEEDTRSVLAVPMLDGTGKSFGMISVQSYQTGVYTIEHEQVLITLAGQVSKAIENAELFAELQQELEIRRQTEEELRQSEEHFSKAFHSNPVAMTITDRQHGIFRDVNAAFCALFGFQREELLGQTGPGLDIITEADRRRNIKTWKEKGEFRDVEIKVHDRKGRELQLLSSVEEINIQGEPHLLMSLVDITERKQAEIALRESEIKFRNMIDTSPVPYALNDKEQNITYLNPAFTKTFGYTLKDIPTLADWWPKAYPDEKYREWVAGTWQERLEVSRQTRRPFEALELNIVGKDGTPRTAIVGASSLTGSFDDVHLVTLIDITDRKQTELALKENEEKFRSIFERAPIGMGLIDTLTGRFLQVNPRYCEIVGRTSAEMLAFDFMSITHPEDVNLDQEQKGRLIKGEIDMYELDKRYLRPDGSVVWAHLTIVAMWRQASDIKIHLTMVEDITESRQAQEKIKQSEALYRSVFSVLSEGLVVQDASDKILAANESAARILGLSMDQLLGKDSYDPRWRAAREDGSPFRPEDHPSMITARTGQPVDNVIMRVSVGDGHRAIISINSRPIHDEAGNVSGVVVSFSDITERKDAEKALMNSRSQLAGVIESAMDAIVTVDENQNITLFNNAAEKMFGFQASEMIGKPHNILLPEASRAIHEAHIRKFGETGVTTRAMGDLVPLIAVRSNGEHFPIEASISQIEIDGRKLFTVILRDVTIRRQAEERQAMLYETLRAVGGSLNEDQVARAAVDIIGRLSRWDGIAISLPLDHETWQTRAIYGEADGVYGKLRSNSEGVIGRVHRTGQTQNVPDVTKDPDHFYGYFSKAKSELVVPIRRGERVLGVIDVESDHLNAFTASDVAFVESLADTISLALDNAHLYAAAQMEILERKRAEAEIQKLNAELEQRVVDRTAQLETANKELEAFSYSVSHDLRAPLRGIDGFSKALVRKYESQLDENGQHYLTRIQENTQRMGQLIDDLLSLSRVTRREMTQISVDLSRLAHEVADGLTREAEGRQISIEIDEPVEAWGDAGLLKIALENLLSNAFKFTSKRSQAVIKFGMMEEMNDDQLQVVYFVRDNGVGFNMQYADKLFGAFQRLHAMDEFPGTGVGLATVQRIIHRHNGRIWVEAEVDKGATIFFTLGDRKA